MKRLTEALKYRLTGDLPADLKRIKVALRMIRKHKLYHASTVPQSWHWVELYEAYLREYRKNLRISRYLVFGSLQRIAWKLLGVISGKILFIKYLETAMLNRNLYTADGWFKFGDGLQFTAPVTNDTLKHLSFIIRDGVLPFVMEQYFPREDVLRYFVMVTRGEGPYEQYPNVVVGQGDVVIDAGSCLGDFALIAACRGAKKVVAFEPMNWLQMYLVKNVGSVGSIDICTNALDSDEKILTFYVDALAGSTAYIPDRDYTAKESTTKVKAITLDQYVRNSGLQRVDFIKADIEGAERHMMLGARETLSKYGPKLSICTYHLPDDPQVISDIIMDSNPNYVIEQTYPKIYAYIPSRKGDPTDA